MKIAFYKLIGVSPYINGGIWRTRQHLLQSEKASFERIKEALHRVEDLSLSFFTEIRIADDLSQVIGDTRYTPVVVVNSTGILWIHEAFLRDCAPQLTIDELTGIFLHEDCHRALDTMTGQFFDLYIKDDSIWHETVMRCLEPLTPYSHYSEALADTYALRFVGRSAITALEKIHRHISEQYNLPYHPDNFSASNSHPSLIKRFEILNFYWQQLEVSKDSNCCRMPLSARHLSTKYLTTDSTSDSEIGTDGQQRYFSWVVQGDNGYDFLQALLEQHHQIGIHADWNVSLSNDVVDANRKKQVKQFIHDVTTLMKLLLGSANLFVDQNGHFVSDNLPFGAVRANRSALSRTALYGKGSITRIYNELKHCEFIKPEMDEYKRKLQKLHSYIRLPSFEQQRIDVANLSDTDQVNQYTVKR